LDAAIPAPGVQLPGQGVEQTVLLANHGFVVIGCGAKRALCFRLAMATCQRVALQQPSGHACAALADPEALGDLVEADGARTEKQISVESAATGGTTQGVSSRAKPSTNRLSSDGKREDSERLMHLK
jgi:hypothetical protein